MANSPKLDTKKYQELLVGVLNEGNSAMNYSLPTTRAKEVLLKVTAEQECFVFSSQ